MRHVSERQDVSIRADNEPHSVHPKKMTKGCLSMHVGSKGWYVEELKKRGVRNHEGRKVEKYKTYVLANLLDKHKN